MSSIKVSVTVPSVGKYMQRLDPNITRYQENLLVRKITHTMQRKTRTTTYIKES